MAGPDDPFGTASLRERVLAAWTASPARFREDANAEEDHALGGYRDRLVVELAQNAADAAARAGVPGALLLTLRDDVLTASNIGGPLDPAAVEALSTLRASAKRDDDPAATVGRFGVGFAAVLAVSDDPVVASRTGSVGWSKVRTTAAVADVPGLADELGRRGGHVPVLRLPWPAPDLPADGFDTTVLLPLRDSGAADLVRAQLAEVDASLLLMLPALATVTVDDGTGARVLRASDLTDAGVRVVATSGRVEPAWLADRPTEERRTAGWSVRWAVPRPPGVPAVLHAPTPTDEPLDLPALLIATFPLEPGRRHVAAGPWRQAMVRLSAEAYVRLVREVAGPEPGPVLDLVPGPVPVGPLDAELRAAILAALRDAPILPAGPGEAGLRPGDALAVDGLGEQAFAVLADAVPGLLPPAWAVRRELDLLGVRRQRLADLVDDLAGLARPPEWWRSVYDGLAAGRVDPDALSGLPVPLADGRLVRGPRGVVLLPESPEQDGLAARLEPLGLRVGAVSHPLLERLGALVADPQAVLRLPAVLALVADSVELDDPGPVAEAVLSLVAAAGGDGSQGTLAALALPDDVGDWTPAGELLLPGGRLAGILAADALGTVDALWVDRWGPDVLRAVGVLDTFAVVRDADVAVDPDVAPHDLDAEDDWLDRVLDGLGDAAASGLPPVLTELVAVRDLDLVDPGRWAEALLALAADLELRSAVLDPARVLTGDGQVVDVPSYTAWWLGEHAVLGGRRPGELALPGADVAGLLDPAPDLGLDDAFLRALGVAGSVADVARSPMHLPLLRAGVRVTDDLHLDLDPDDAGTEQPVPEVLERVLGGPMTFVEHADLRVGGVPCDWWVDGAGTPHAATTDGLARALAWSTGRWRDRLLLAGMLAEPDRAEELLAEAAWD